MAYLKLGEESCEVTFTHEDSTHSKSHSSDPDDQKMVVTLSIFPAKMSELNASLGELMNKEGSELRTEISKEWTVFWKVRTGESRLLLARPEVDQWVATLALSASHLSLLREKLVSSPGGFNLSDLEGVSRVSNLEVILREKT